MRLRGCPTRRAGLPIALVLACAATAAVADVYKIVGPDGRVTYSDRPPVDARSAVVAHTSASAPRVTISPLVPNDAESASAPARAASGAPAAASRAPLAPDLSDALVAVLADERLVQSMFDTCTHAQPTSYERLSDRVRTWRRHNVQLIAQADRVLDIGVSESGRAALQASAQGRVDALLQPVLHGPPPHLAQWCNRGAEQLLDGTLDLAGRPEIVDPIARWTAP